MQLNMDRLLRETARPGREPAWERRQSEINGDGQKKVSAQGEPECENVSIAERKREDGGKGRTLVCVSRRRGMFNPAQTRDDVRKAGYVSHPEVVGGGGAPPPSETWSASITPAPPQPAGQNCSYPSIKRARDEIMINFGGRSRSFPIPCDNGPSTEILPNSKKANADADRPTDPPGGLEGQASASPSAFVIYRG